MCRCYCAGGDRVQASTSAPGTLTYGFDSVAIATEHVHGSSQWHYGEQQDVTYTGLGTNYVW